MIHTTFEILITINKIIYRMDKNNTPLTVITVDNSPIIQIHYGDSILIKNLRWIPYIEFGVLVEASKYEAVKRDGSENKLKDSVNELEISVDDMKKYNRILQKLNESE